MNSIKKILFGVLIYLLMVANTFGQELTKNPQMPTTIAFSGSLKDENHNNYPDDYYSFTFYLFPDEKSTTPLWSEKHQDVFVEGGNFNVILGSKGSPIKLDSSFSSNVKLGLKINDGKLLERRFSLLPVPYSLGSNYAENVSINSISEENFAANSVTDEKIKNFSLEKIIDFPASLGSIEALKNLPQVMGSDYEWWTTSGNIIYGPERHYLGTRNARDFAIYSWELQRMLFDPLGNVTIGTTHHPVHFEVIGKSTFTDDAYIKGVLGVGVYPTLAKMHINSTGRVPFKVDYNTTNLFSIEQNGRTSIKSSVAGSDGDNGNYPLFIDAEKQGIAIKVDGNASGDNNYISFWTENNTLGDNMAGRIEGQTIPEYLITIPNIIRNTYIVALGVALGLAIANASEEPADIITIGADLAENAIYEGIDFAGIGVTYESGSGDYAEWLEKENASENFRVGEIVGVNGGKITKSTENAELLFAISTSPIVLGNSPKGDEKNYEKVAFMGQIPIKVMGKVNYGDFIIPSGLNDGTGIALSPELISVDNYKDIVGQAWSNSTTDALSLINVHIGLDNRDLAKVLNNFSKDNINLSSEINEHSSDVQMLEARTKVFDKKLDENYEKINVLLDFLKN